MYSYVNHFPSEVNTGGLFGACAITPDGSTLAVGGRSDSNVGTNTGRIVVYNTNDFSIKGNIIRGADSNRIGVDVSINDAGDRVFTTCADNTARVYQYSTGTWTLMFTTPATPSSFFGLSIKCNSVGDKFFYTQGDNVDAVIFYSYDGSSWSEDTARNTLSPMSNYSWVSDTDALMDNIVGTTEDTNVNAVVSNWNGTNWSQRGSSLGGGTKRYVSAGISADGNTVALFHLAFPGSSVDVFDWDTGTSDWVARSSIVIDSGNARIKIPISTDKNTICIIGDPYSGPNWGVWTWDSGTDTWNQDLSLYPSISANITPFGEVGFRVPAMSGDKYLVASPYYNYDYDNGIYEDGFAVFVNGPPPPPSPLVVPQDDGTYVFNIHPTDDTALTGVPTLSSNDDYTSPQVDQTGTFTLYNNVPEVSVNSSNALVVELDHPTGAFEIEYTVTDQNSTVSEPATIDYIVVNFGLHLPDDVLPPIADVTVNTPTTIVTAAFITGVLGRITSDLETVPDLEVEFTLTSGSMYASTATYDYTVAELLAAPITSPPFGGYTITPDEDGPEEVVVTFKFNGWEFSLQRSFNIVNPPPIIGGIELFPVPPTPAPAPAPGTGAAGTTGLSTEAMAVIAIAAVAGIIAILIMLGII